MSDMPEFMEAEVEFDTVDVEFLDREGESSRTGHTAKKRRQTIERCLCRKQKRSLL